MPRLCQGWAQVCAAVTVFVVAPACIDEFHQGTFVVIDEADTLTIEQYRRTNETLEVELVNRLELLRTILHGSMDSVGAIKELSFQVRRLGAPENVPDLGTANCLSLGIV